MNCKTPNCIRVVEYRSLGLCRYCYNRLREDRPEKKTPKPKPDRRIMAGSVRIGNKDFMEGERCIQSTILANLKRMKIEKVRVNGREYYPAIYRGDKCLLDVVTGSLYQGGRCLSSSRLVI